MTYSVDSRNRVIHQQLELRRIRHDRKVARNNLMSVKTVKCMSIKRRRDHRNNKDTVFPAVQRFGSLVLSIETLFCCIMSYLPCKQLSVAASVNKMFNFELHYKFICQNFDFYFQYNRIQMKKIIQHQLLLGHRDNLPHLSSLVKFYFSYINYLIQETIFTFTTIATQ